MLRTQASIPPDFDQVDEETKKSFALHVRRLRSSAMRVREGEGDAEAAERALSVREDSGGSVSMDDFGLLANEFLYCTMMDDCVLLPETAGYWGVDQDWSCASEEWINTSACQPLRRLRAWRVMMRDRNAGRQALLTTALRLGMEIGPDLHIGSVDMGEMELNLDSFEAVRDCAAWMLSRNLVGEWFTRALQMMPTEVPSPETRSSKRGGLFPAERSILLDERPDNCQGAFWRTVGVKSAPRVEELLNDPGPAEEVDGERESVNEGLVRRMTEMAITKKE